MNDLTLNLSSSPHARDRWTTPYIMRVVLLSLMPATIMGCIVYGWHALAIVVLSVASAMLAEAVFNKVVHKPSAVWDGSAAVTGLLLALSLGPRTPLYLPVIGSVFAIVVVKGCFGGLGKNFINPALAARCFLLISFASSMAIQPVVDATSSATPMGMLRNMEDSGWCDRQLHPGAADRRTDPVEHGYHPRADLLLRAWRIHAVYRTVRRPGI